MTNCKYAIEGIEHTLLNFEIFTENDTMLLYTEIRQFRIPFDQMPAFLQRWVPLRAEGVPYYNHLLEEAGIATPIQNTLPVSAPPKEPITQEDILQSMIVDYMKDMKADMQSVHDTLNAATKNIKDIKSGTGGAAFVNQAAQIANLSDKMIKAKLATLQGLGLALRVIENAKKSGKKKKENDDTE